MTRMKPAAIIATKESDTMQMSRPVYGQVMMAAGVSRGR